MITIFGLQITILQIIEAIPSIIATLQSLEQVYRVISSNSLHTSAMEQTATILGKQVLGAIAGKAGVDHPTPFTPAEQAIWDRASAMS